MFFPYYVYQSFDDAVRPKYIAYACMGRLCFVYETREME